MHQLLAVQLAELGLGRERVPNATEWRQLLDRVELAYRSADAHRPAADRARVVTSSEQMLRTAEELARADAVDAAAKKQQLAATRAVLDATLDALADGVLVVDHETRGVSLYNRRFAEMWQIPAAALASRDDQQLLGCVVSLLADPDEFFARVGYLYEHPTESSQEEVRLRDGRTFERQSAPVTSLDGKVLGRVWFFHDATERRAEQQQLVDAERKAAVIPYERELAIAQQIQTTILPKQPSVRGLEIATGMRTASAVGGDYFEVIPTADGGCWLGIGDVSGHGLNAGLSMLMVQSGISSLVRRDPDADPKDVLVVLNAMLHDNIHRRLGLDDFVTLSLLRYSPDGRVAISGAHEDILVWRAAHDRVDRWETEGAWLGADAAAAATLSTSRATLAPGDVLLLYTDGVTEARDASNEQFGLDRLERTLAAHHGAPVAAIRDAIYDAASSWEPERRDDQSLVVARYTGRAG